MPFDKVVMLLRERMGSKKLLLKQRKWVVEVFTSGRDAFVSFPTSYSKNFCHGCVSTAKKSLRRVSLSCRYGLNGEKHVLHINPNRSNHSVPTIVWTITHTVALSLLASRSLVMQQCKRCELMYCGSSLHS